jgi:hypothetical protein
MIAGLVLLVEHRAAAPRSPVVCDARRQSGGLRRCPRPPAQSQRLTRRQARRPAHGHLGHGRLRNSPTPSSEDLTSGTPASSRRRQSGSSPRTANIAAGGSSLSNRSKHRAASPTANWRNSPGFLRRRSARAGSHRTPVTGRGPRFEAPRSEAKSRTRLSSHLPPNVASVSVGGLSTQGARDAHLPPRSEERPPRCSPAALTTPPRTAAPCTAFRADDPTGETPPAAGKSRLPRCRRCAGRGPVRSGNWARAAVEATGLSAGIYDCTVIEP